VRLAFPSTFALVALVLSLAGSLASAAPEDDERAHLAALIPLKVSQVEANRVDYPDRARDLRSMYEYLAEGKFDMVVYKADNIIEQQRNLAAGVPPDVASKMAQVQDERVEYPDRDRDVRTMNEYAAEGKYDMVVYKADNILEQQRSLSGGMPADVAAKVAQVEAERVDYPDRARDVRSMHEYAAEGKFDMVVYKADNILEQQRNLAAGVPSAVEAKVAKVEAQRVDYPGRDRDVRSMNDYLAEGRYDMVIYKADNILEQQNNLR